MVVTIEQIAALLDIMEGNHELALGRCSRTKEGRSLAKRMWQDVATKLNSIGPSCDSKSPEEWRIFYSDYKYKLTRKIKKMKGEHSATGGGPAKKIMLTVLEDRLYTILGRDIGDPLPGVRRNPLSEININSQQEGSDLNCVVLDISEPREEINDQFMQPCEEDSLLNTYDTGATIENITPCQLETAPVQIEATHLPSQPTPRRRRARQRRSATQHRLEPESTHFNLQQATDQLATIERLSADATMEQARGTHRIADALERIASAMERIVDASAREPTNEF